MFLEKLFGTKSEREIKQLSPSIDKINQYYESLIDKTDQELIDKTQQLKEFVINARKEKEDALPQDMDKEERATLILAAEHGALDFIVLRVILLHNFTREV